MRITKIKIENFFSIKEADIEVQDGKTLITGINFDDDGADNSGVGKSSIIASIGWAIFGEIPKNISVDKVIRFGTEQTTVSVDFDDGTLIERRRGKINSLDFWYRRKDVTKRTTSMTQQEIFKKFGMKGTSKQCFLDFLNTVYLNSSTVETFSSNEFSSADRFQFISRIMNLDIWKKASDLAKKDKDKIDDELDDVRVKLEAEKEHFVNKTEENLLNDKKKIEDKIKDLIALIEIADKKLTVIEKKNSDGYGLRDKLILSESDLVNAQKVIIDKEMSYGYRVQTLQDTLERQTKAFDGLQEIKNSGDSWTDDDAVERITGKLDKLKTEKGEILDENQRNHSQLFKLDEDIKNFRRQLESHQLCPHCEKEILISEKEIKKYDSIEALKISNNMLQERETLQTKEDKLKEEIEAKGNRVKEGEEVLEKAKQVQIEEKNFWSILNDIDEFTEANLVELKDERDEYKEESGKEINELNVKIIEAKAKFEAFETIDTTEKENELANLQDERDDQNIHLGSCEQTIKDFLKHVKYISELETQKKALKGSVKSSKFWTKAFIEIRRMVIESSLPRLESSINSYLKRLNMPFQVVIDTLREVGKEGKLREEFNINVLDLTNSRIDTIETYSDGQKKRIGLAVCFALNDFLKDRDYPFNFLLIDQLLDTDIDDVGVNMVMEILDSMNNQKLIISHNTELKDRFINVMWLEKKNGITKIGE